MSFTVMRYKDGKPAPIKMSIWDAFKGAPPPRSRTTKPKPCPCCKKVHPKNPPQQETPTGKKDGVVAEASKDVKSDKSEPKSDGKANHSDKEIETYTNEDNKKLIDLKAAGETWKNILTALDKNSLSQLKAHWKGIEGASKVPANGEKVSGDDAEKRKKEQEEREKQTKIEKEKAIGQAKKQQQKQTSEAAKSDDKKDKTSEPGDTELKAFAKRYDRYKWAAAASKHYDLTGQRITPELARKMAEGK